MPGEIWVAYDEAPEADWALDFALDWARVSGAHLSVVLIVAVIDEAAQEQEGLALELLGVDENARRRELLRRRLRAAAPNVDSDVRLLASRGAEPMLDVLRAERPDVVVVGRRRRGPLGRLLSGDLGATLAKHSPSPVVLVPEPRPRPRRREPIRSAPASRPGRQNGGAPPNRPMVDDEDRPRLPMAATDTPASSRPTMLRQLFAATAPILIVATVVLILTPVSVSSNPVLVEALALGAGGAIMLAIHLVLMRRTLAPLRWLTESMGAIDPSLPDERIPTEEGTTREITALTGAFNALLDRIEAQERRSARRALAAQEDERLRIAREIHDELGQSLTAVTIQAERAAELDGPVDRELLRQLAATALRSLDDVRRIGRELRPEALDDLGLGSALITLCRRMSNQGAMRVVPRLEPGGPPLAPEVELVIYRIAQEAITNALRHSGAGKVELTLERSGSALELVVADDGRGMPERLPDDTAGIGGMRERARLVGGRLRLDGAPGSGTEVRLTIPLEEAAARVPRMTR